MLVLSSLAAPDLHLICLRFVVLNAWCIAARAPCGGEISDYRIIYLFGLETVPGLDWIDEDRATKSPNF